MSTTKDREDAIVAGSWLGRQQALGLIAGRCSVAEIECLIEVYENKLYLAVEETWEDYCKLRLGISRRTAERLMRTHRSQGPRLAKLNCFTRIRPKEYQTFLGMLTNDGLNYNGEVIPLEPENAPRLLQAVEAIRAEATPQTEPVDDVARALGKAEKSLNSALTEIVRLQTMDLNAENRERLNTLLEAGTRDMERLLISVY